MNARAIVIGQYLGLSALTAASILAAMLAIRVHTPWLGALGLAPFLLGVRALVLVWQTRDEKVSGTTSEASAKTRFDNQWITVALVTIANGGDNLSVYIPLFAETSTAIPLHVVVFAVMTALWCVLSHSLVHHRILGSHIQRYGRIALPFVLMGLGVDLMWSLRNLIR